jgi:uncharacterized protein YecE (DUF72 family)
MLRLALLEMAGLVLWRRAANDWFGHCLKHFDTVEINASYYSWPTVAGVQAWRRQPGKKKFVYTVKVCELITHIKTFKGTKTLVRDFEMISDILGDRMGCFLFQLAPSYRYAKARLNEIVGQLDPGRRNVVEFRHASWWNEDVYSAFRKAGIIFCSCGGPRLPDELVQTARWDLRSPARTKALVSARLLKGRTRDMGGPDQGQRRETRVGLFQ